jgi:hypothetical protein
MSNAPDYTVSQRSRRRPTGWRRRIAGFAVAAMVSAMSVTVVLVLVSPGPSALINGFSSIDSTPFDSRGRAVPDLIAGHVGWCSYPGSSNDGGACVAIAPAVPSERAGPLGTACGFHSLQAPGLTAQWGQRAIRATAPDLHLAPGVLVSCASTFFSFGPTVLLAAVLASARDHGSAGPAPRDTAGTVTMRRNGGAWIAVEGGTLPLRVQLLSALRPTRSAFCSCGG